MRLGKKCSLFKSHSRHEMTGKMEEMTKEQTSRKKVLVWFAAWLMWSLPSSPLVVMQWALYHCNLNTPSGSSTWGSIIAGNKPFTKERKQGKSHLAHVSIYLSHQHVECSRTSNKYPSLQVSNELLGCHSFLSHAAKIVCLIIALRDRIHVKKYFL